MQVQDEVVDALRHEPADDPPDHRLTGHRNGRLCTDIAERAQPRTVTGSQDQGVVDRGVFLYSSSNNIISVDGMPRFSQSSMYRRR